MKKFILKCSAFFILVLGILSFVLVFYGGYIDYFYEKFTTSKTNSIIIGDSRAMQGIQPKIIDSVLVNTNLELPILNYSFTIEQSHIGQLYNKSIFKKLNKNAKNGLFILAINPWMLSSKKTFNNEKGEFNEIGLPPHNMSFVSMNPNFEYFIKNFNYFHFKAIFRQKTLLHKDGWLEEKNSEKDSLKYKDWKKNQLNMFNNFEKDFMFSDYRIKSLDTLIKALKIHGKVVIARLPVDSEILKIENTFCADFDLFIENISYNNNIPYYNYTKKMKNNSFTTNDGHHLNKVGSLLFTKSLCDSIIKDLR